jgi:hypothetical protein
MRLADDDFERTFQIFIDDNRYTVPSLYIVTVRSEQRAREIAERLVQESDHHLGAEICENGEPLMTLGSYAERAAAALPQSVEG